MTEGRADSAGRTESRSTPVNGTAPPGSRPVAEVVCAADECYSLPLAVMLESLLANLASSPQPTVHIIDCGLSASSRQRIDALTLHRANVVWHGSRRSCELGDPAWGHVSGATYERLLLEDYLAEETRLVLWLDCDLLILDDLSPLLQAEADGTVLRAVRDPFIPRVSAPFGIRDWQRLGLARDAPYFNAGVIRVDMRQWRAQGIARRALDYLSTYGRKVYFNEQEALNAVAAGRWAPLDDRWNLSANPIHAGRQAPGSPPAIVHFAGRVKPWAVPGLGDLQERYFECLDRTPWRGLRPKRTVATRLLSWYLGSRLRPMTYWLENQQLKLRHLWGL